MQRDRSIPLGKAILILAAATCLSAFQSATNPWLPVDHTAFRAHLASLSAEEKTEQLRDWALIAASMDAEPENKAPGDTLSTVQPLRIDALHNVTQKRVGVTRWLPLANNRILALIADGTTGHCSTGTPGYRRHKARRLVCPQVTRDDDDAGPLREEVGHALRLTDAGLGKRNGRGVRRSLACVRGALSMTDNEGPPSFTALLCRSAFTHRVRVCSPRWPRTPACFHRTIGHHAYVSNRRPKTPQDNHHGQSAANKIHGGRFRQRIFWSYG